MTDYFSCPHCGEDVPSGALACPHCGSDESTGWSDVAGYDGFYFPDDEPQPKPGAAGRWTRYAVAGVIALLLTALIANLLPHGAYLAIVLLPLAIGLTYYLQEVAPRRQGGRQRQLFQALLRRARGDEALVERLIEYERQRHPLAGPGEWLQDAWDRWERDAR